MENKNKIPVTSDLIAKIARQYLRPPVNEDIYGFAYREVTKPLTYRQKFRRWNRDRNRLYVRICKRDDWIEPGSDW